MEQFIYKVTDPEGFHARSASYLLKAIRNYSCQVHMLKDGRAADARDIFKLLSLNVKQGDTIILTFDGDGEKEAAEDVKNKLKEFL